MILIWYRSHSGGVSSSILMMVSYPALKSRQITSGAPSISTCLHEDFFGFSHASAEASFRAWAASFARTTTPRRTSYPPQRWLVPPLGLSSYILIDFLFLAVGIRSV
ncbi:hypothetical protein LCGC14_2747460 [marine sediment metagenome]|uniref:Uncharacterized protein n=1 Tax=marine sediment metagenome TaxID=412755 RepID=A0A0F8ZPS3_9ZZZZ